MERIELIGYTAGPFEENPYLLIGPSGRRAAIVDPGFDAEFILDEASRRNLEITWILNTHGHLDHTAGNRFFKEKTGAPLAIHAADIPFLKNLQLQAEAYGLRADTSPDPDVELREGHPIDFDGVALEVLHTPGHSPGSICLVLDDRVLVGDTLFRGSVGRTDLPGGSWDLLFGSIREKLFRFPDTTRCYPGHGPETTIGEERRMNPFVSDAAAASERS